MKARVLAIAGLLAATTAAGAELGGRVELYSGGKALRAAEAVDAVVYFRPRVAAARPPAPVTATMTTRRKQFVPRVLAVTAGSEVRFPNEDPILHNVFSTSPDNSFDAGQYHTGPGVSHRFDHVGLVQGFARRARNGEGWRGQGGGVEVLGAGACGRLRLFRRQQALHGAGHRACEANADDAHHDVEGQVEQHHQGGGFGHVGAHMLQPQAGKRRHDEHANDLEEQIAQRHLACLHVGLHGGHHGEHAAAQVGAQHQPQRHIGRNTARTRQRRSEQHGGKAGVRHDGQNGAGKNLQQQIAGERAQQRAHGGRLGEHRGRFGDEAQRQQHQPQADQHAAHAAHGGVLARDEQHHAHKDEQGRQPRQVHGEHHGHHAGAHVGAQHHGQRCRQAHQALAHKRRHDERGGCAGLHHGRHANTGKHCGEAAADAVRNQLAQVGAEHAQDAGAHQVGAPDQQRHGCQEIEEMLHENRCFFFL